MTSSPFFVFFLSLSSLKANFLSQAVSLPCSTVGNPPPRLSWIHRDSLVYSGEQFQVTECGFAGGDFCICSHLENGIFQVLSDGTLLMKEVRENIEELTCQVKMWPLDMENHSIGARFQKCLGPVKLLNDILGSHEPTKTTKKDLSPEKLACRWRTATGRTA